MPTKASRIKSGIAGLDQVIAGGFVKGHGILVTGSYGTGKTTMGMQFLVEGAKTGEPGLYITFEEQPEQLIEEGESLGWDISSLISQKKLKILRIVPQDLINVVEAGFGQVGDIVDSIGVQRVVVDSVISFEMQGKDDYERRKMLMDLVSWFKKKGCTVMMTMDTDPGKELEPKFGIAESATDAIIVLYHPKDKGKRIRQLEILKMRETCHTDNFLDFSIGDKGLKIIGKGKGGIVCD
jgi:circadian clock protein KaiC